MSNKGCYKSAASSYDTNKNSVPIVPPIPADIIPEIFLNNKPHDFIQKDPPQQKNMNCSGYKMFYQTNINSNIPY